MPDRPIKQQVNKQVKTQQTASQRTNDTKTTALERHRFETKTPPNIQISPVAVHY